jgi:ABC-type glycerol-3-phosphate transport system substrate-binding protein
VAQATTKLGLPRRYGAGFIARHGTAILDPFTPILRSAGGDFYNPKTGEIFINRPPAIEALEFYGDLVTKYHVMNPDSITWEFDGIIAGGQNDQFAMTITLAPYGELMNDPKQSKTGGNWAWAMVPGKDSITQSRTHLGGWVLGVPEGCKYTEWAFEFIQLATSKQWLRRSIDLANSPPRLSVLQDPTVLAKHPWAPVHGESLKTATLDPQDALWSTALLPLRVAVSQVLLFPSRKKTPMGGDSPRKRNSLSSGSVIGSYAGGSIH